MKRMLFFLFITAKAASAQRLPDVVYMPNIKSVKLFVQNNQESLPVIKLNSNDLLELHFDDLDAYAKSYYYSFELCNADWSPADLSSFDYIRGFQNQQLTEYRASSVSTTNYIHYQALLPDKNCMPSKSGNYLLKVFLDGDENKLAFTKRFYVLENKIAVNAQVMQTFNSQLYISHQKVQFTINASALNLFDLQQQLKVTVLQNYRWDNALSNMQPTFNRDNILEYNGEEDVLFPAGKEYRWVDLRSFRFQSERVGKIDNSTKPLSLYLKPDAVRVQQPYVRWSDLNGFYEISASEFINPWWQGDYANVHFTFFPNNKQTFENKDVYISGELTGNNISEDAKMQFSETKNAYEKTLLLKQGYYNYTYITKDAKDANAKPDASLTDGNSWETENDYIILVYYRSLSGRHDELVAIKIINSKNVR